MKFIFIRQDPPFDMSYITSLHILELLDTKKTRVINDPKGIRNSPEKKNVVELRLFWTDFRELDKNVVRMDLTEEQRQRYETRTNCS